MGRSASRFLLCAAAVAIASSTYASEDDVTGWLLRMDRALRDLDYEGRLVFVHGNAVEALQLTHSAEDGRERLVSLNGPAREVKRDDAELVCPVPDVGQVSLTRSDGSVGGARLVALDPLHLGEGYEARLEGEARIAGRAARVVALVPRDRYRYGHRLYLDAESALPLKADLLDERGTPLTQAMFVSFEVRGGRPPAAGTAPPARPVRTAELAPLPLRFATVPPGFRLAASGRRTLPGSGRELQHVVFNDGATSVSVYVASPAHHDLQGLAEVGAVNAFGRRVGAHQVTAMGEVPAATLEALVDGVVVGAEEDTK